MLRERKSRKNAARAFESRNIRLGFATTLALMSIVSASLLAQGSSRTRSKVTSAAVSVASLIAGRPSKEYIHAGAMLVATGEPSPPETPRTKTIGVYSPADAAFFLRNSNTGGVADIAFNFGPAGMGFIPIVGDWDGDGGETVGLYDPAGAAFFLKNSNAGGVADIAFNFGPAGMGFIPIVGDWNGDGVDTVGLYDPAGAAFFLRNSNTGGVADIAFNFGSASMGFVPIVGDWDGDGVDTVGLYDPAGAAFFLRNSNTGGIADITFTFGPAGLGYKPLAGDWNGDGVDTVGLYDPGNAAFFLRNSNTGGVADIAFTFGPSGLGFIPIVGAWAQNCTIVPSGDTTGHADWNNINDCLNGASHSVTLGIGTFYINRPILFPQLTGVKLLGSGNTASGSVIEAVYASGDCSPNPSCFVADSGNAQFPLRYQPIIFTKNAPNGQISNFLLILDQLQKEL